MTYRIQVKVKDKGSGEVKVHPTTWKPPVGLTPKQVEREVIIYASEYENAVKAAETAVGEPNISHPKLLSQSTPPGGLNGERTTYLRATT